MKRDGALAAWEKISVFQKLLVIGIALFVLNWFYLVLHHTDFQLARDTDLGESKKWGWIISTGLSLLIYIMWLIKIHGDRLIMASPFLERTAFLKGALVTLLLVNWVLAFVMKNDVETLNARLDKSSPQIKEVVITDKYFDTVYNSHESSDYYYVCFPDQDGKKFSLYVDTGFYDSVQKGSHLSIVTRAGYFGWPWIVKFEKITG